MNQPAISLLSVLVSDEHRPHLPLSLIFLGSTSTSFKQTNVLSSTYSICCDILLSRLVRDRLTSSPLSRYPSSKFGAALGHGQGTPLSLSITCKSPRSIYNLHYYR